MNETWLCIVSVIIFVFYLNVLLSLPFLQFVQMNDECCLRKSYSEIKKSKFTVFLPNSKTLTDFLQQRFSDYRRKIYHFPCKQFVCKNQD